MQDGIIRNRNLARAGSILVSIRRDECGFRQHAQRLRKSYFPGQSSQWKFYVVATKLRDRRETTRRS
jgi:hypothetical protein